MKLNYKISDIFMVRVPSLPFNTLNKIENYNSIKELTNSIRFDININDLLMISNLALYNTYKCKKLTKKTEKQLNMSIKNYIRRTVTRPTPFGISSGVEMGYFADKTNLVLDSNGFMNFAKIDTEWLYKLVYLIQSDKRNLDRLFFYSNQDLHTIGNMIKNNDVVDISNSMNNMSEILIKKSYLIEEILELCERGIRGDILKRKVMNDYSGVSEEKVDKIINNLIDCGYLITDLFPIAFHEDSLKHILDWLNKNRPCSELLSSLLKIERYISKYNHDNNIEHLKYIYSIMEKIVSSNNYVHVTRKLSLREKTISVQVKEEVERFINNISRINISKCDRYKKFKYKFLDTYGYNSKINILDLFEENRNGLIYDIYQLEYLDVQDCENYLSIKSYIRNSINEAIINGKDEVYLDTEKLISLCVKEGEDKYEYIDTFDINFILRKEHNKHDIILAPIASSNRAGQMINRFSCVLDNNLYDEYLSFIRRCDKSIENKKNISLVEIREITNQTRMLNIRNYEKITDSHLPISIKTHWNGKINIKDIFVYIDINNKINVIDNKTGNNIKIVSNDMLNSYTKSRLNKILYNLTNNEISVLDVIRSAINNEFTYIPRVKIDDIYINMKRWKVENNLLNTENIVSFKDKIKEIFEMYKIPQYVYLTDDDNRLLINICDETDLEYIYKYSRKREISLFEEVEYDKDHQPVVKDERLQRFCSEITVSVYNEENDIKKENDEYLYKNDSIRYDQSNIYFHFSNNWIYLKLYYSKNRDRDILIWIGELNKKNINIQKKFVVRYQDIKGEHIRYRIKLNDNEDDKQIVTLFREFNEFSKTGAIKDVDICTYYQETNRYGGINLIDDIETFFDADTKLIIHINELYKIDTLDRYQEFQLYTIGILTILLEFYYDYEEIYIKLHKNVVDNNNKKYYRSMKEYIIPFIETIINGEMPIKTRIDEQKLLCRKKEMRKIKSKLESYGDDERDNIIFSLIHMYCNRLNGDNTLENKYLELIKYALKEIISRNKYIRSKSYNGETYN